MLSISRTPVRISFFGGGTDYPAFYDHHFGAVLGTTINHYTYITVKKSIFSNSTRIVYSKTEEVKNFNEIEHPSIRECLKHRDIQDNLEIHIFSDLPAGTGLGSSSSFTVGFLHALDVFQGKKSSKQQLAEEACFVEQKCIQENVGSQDQFHTAFGGFNHIEFKDTGIDVRSVVLSEAKKVLLEEHLLIFFTGMVRRASDVVQEQIDKTAQNGAYLKEMLALVPEAEDILCVTREDQLVEKFGRLVHKSWLLKKQLSSKISNPTIDEAYAAALNAGAYGGKLCGAGNGGFLVFFVPLEKHNSVREALGDMQEIDFKFEDEGSTIVYTK